MEHVGIRQLKDRLAHYVRAVQRGEIVTVTVRRKPVARLVPIAPEHTARLPEDVEVRVWELAGEGVLSWNGRQAQLPEPAATNQGAVLLSDMVVEGRE